MTSTENRPWPDDETLGRWEQRNASLRGGAAYADLHGAQRGLQDLLSGAVLPADAAAEVTASLQALSARLAQYQVPESERWDGWRPDLPGRGHPLLPPFIVDEETDALIRGRVTFTRFYLGGNGAAHGGAAPLLFDDLLGKVVNHHHRDGVARTAYLTVNYRRIVPIGRQLQFDATIDKVEGRKRWGSARLREDDGVVLCDAEGLYVQLRPGQP